MTVTIDESKRPDAAGQRQPAKLDTKVLAIAAVFIATFAFIASIMALGVLMTRSLDDHRHLEEAIAASGGSNSASGSDSASAESPASAAPTVDVALREFSIAPSTVDVPAGATIRVVNDGSIKHNLSVDGRASAMVTGGKSTELDLTGLAPGTYTMRCDVPGHEAAGMRGTVTVS